MLFDPGSDEPERSGLSASQGVIRRFVGGMVLASVVVQLLLADGNAAANTKAEPSRVLIVYQDSSVLKSSTEIADGIGGSLEKSSAGRLDVYTEFLDAPRFSGKEDFRRSAEYLSSKYESLQINILVAIGPEALRFVLEHKASVAPDAIVVFGDISDRTYARLKPSEDFAGVITGYDVRRSVDLALGLQQSPAGIVVFSGSAEFDNYWQNSARAALGDRYRTLPVTYLSGLSPADFAGRASRLDPRTILLILTIFEDSLGRKYRPRDAVSIIAEASGAPSYGLLSSYVGTGIVGGHMATYESIGTDVARLIAKAANGDNPGVVHATSHPVVDWRQMQRWQMDRASLPAASQLLYFKPTLWEEYQWQILAVALLVLTQALAIAALYAERRSRRSAEVQARSRLLELVHLNQSATAGALSASIAHELNQPLGAIRNNAEAAEAILRGATPDLSLIKQIVADIKDDDQRAGDIIRRLRALLKKRSEIEWQEFDLNEVVDGAISILRAEAVEKRVAVSADRSTGRLPVRADVVHVQQVILNLATNAMDAMVDAATADRRLILQTKLYGYTKAVMSISDTGRGIPKERLESIFDAFYTTKPNGTGLGLSIARTIVETYGGKIWADNRAEGGAVFCFVLPLAKGA